MDRILKWWRNSSKFFTIMMCQRLVPDKTVFYTFIVNAVEAFRLISESFEARGCEEFEQVDPLDFAVRLPEAPQQRVPVLVVPGSFLRV